MGKSRSSSKENGESDISSSVSAHSTNASFVRFDFSTDMDVYDEDGESPEKKSGLSAIFTKMISHKSGETRHPHPLKKVHSMTLHKHMESFSEEQQSCSFLEEFRQSWSPAIVQIDRKDVRISASALIPFAACLVQWKNLLLFFLSLPKRRAL